MGLYSIKFTSISGKFTLIYSEMGLYLGIFHYFSWISRQIALLFNKFSILGAPLLVIPSVIFSSEWGLRTN